MGGELHEGKTRITVIMAGSGTVLLGGKPKLKSSRSCCSISRTGRRFLNRDCRETTMTFVQLNLDLYNAFSSNKPVTIFGACNARWGQPAQVPAGRLGLWRRGCG